MNQWICTNLFKSEREVQSEKEHTKRLARQDPRLKVYYNVPISDLIQDEETGKNNQETSCSNGYLSYLICINDEVLLALDREPLIKGADGPIICDWVGRKLNGDTAFVWNWDPFTGEDEEYLAKYIREYKKCLLKPVPAEIQGRLAELRLIKPSEAGPWVPTMFGQECGLTMGYLPMGNDKVCCTPCWSENNRRRIQKVFSWGQEDGINWDKVPLEKRAQRLCSGLPGNSIYSRNIVERFANTLLSDYLRNEPEAYKELKENLPPSAVTYQQAAFHIHELLQKDSSRRLGKKLMRCLTEPIVNEEKQRR